MKYLAYVKCIHVRDRLGHQIQDRVQGPRRKMQVNSWSGMVAVLQQELPLSIIVSCSLEGAFTADLTTYWPIMAK